MLKRADGSPHSGVDARCYIYLPTTGLTVSAVAPLCLPLSPSTVPFSARFHHRFTQFLRIPVGGPLRRPEIRALQRGIGLQPQFVHFVQEVRDFVVFVAVFVVVLVVVLVVADPAAARDAKEPEARTERPRVRRRGRRARIPARLCLEPAEDFPCRTTPRWRYSGPGSIGGA